jgi:hypothetical protein
MQGSLHHVPHACSLCCGSFGSSTLALLLHSHRRPITIIMSCLYEGNQLEARAVAAAALAAVQAFH